MMRAEAKPVAMAEPEMRAGRPVIVSGSAAQAVAVASAVVMEEAVATAVEEEVAAETATAPGGALDVDALRGALAAALADAGHASAATLVEAAALSVEGTTVQIAVGIGKKMIGLTFNPAAEKILRQELQKAGAPARFLIVPGETTEGGRSVTAAAKPRAGSIQETALAHPLVEHAREVFKAEVRSVIDLQTK